MAARIDAPGLTFPDLVDLRTLSARDLDPLLDEEIVAWREGLEWQFEQSVSLVRRFVDLHALNGYALIEDGQVIGYVYYVLEDNKGLIGDLYVRRDWRTAEREERLLQEAVNSIIPVRRVQRIESQLLMLRYSPSSPVPWSKFGKVYERDFMRMDLAGLRMPEAPIRRPVVIDQWGDHHHDAAGQLIATAYSGHVDSQINDQYRSVMGARKFLFNIVQFPGCGTFFRPASFSAFEPETGRLCGISLASLVAPEAGHITQICVSPSVRGTGVGYELLRRSIQTLKDSGCHSVSLTVTAANSAVRLYESVGFTVHRRFPAYAWEGFH
jgi:ribosomal protein S18 acetylase RimI-like enzyme